MTGVPANCDCIPRNVFASSALKSDARTETLASLLATARAAETGTTRRTIIDRVINDVDGLCRDIRQISQCDKDGLFKKTGAHLHHLGYARPYLSPSTRHGWHGVARVRSRLALLTTS